MQSFSTLHSVFWLATRSSRSRMALIYVNFDFIHNIRPKGRGWVLFVGTSSSEYTAVVKVKLPGLNPAAVLEHNCKTKLASSFPGLTASDTSSFWGSCCFQSRLMSRVGHICQVNLASHYKALHQAQGVPRPHTVVEPKCLHDICSHLYSCNLMKWVLLLVCPYLD